MRQGMLLSMCGIGAGFLAALLFTHVLSGLLYGVTATAPVTFASVAVVLLAVAASAVIPPAWRATQVDPIVTLRAE